MDINKMLAEIRQERDQLDEAIAVLGRLSLGQGKRRGRPPKWMTAVKILPIECSTHFHLDLKAYCPQTDTDNRQYDNLWSCENCLKVDSRAATVRFTVRFWLRTGSFL